MVQFQMEIFQVELTDKLLVGLSVIGKSHFTGTQKILGFTAPTHFKDQMTSPNLRNTNFFII